MLAEIRQAIADAISTRLPEVQVSPYMLGSGTAPSIDVIPDSTEYDKAMQRGLDEWHLRVRAFVAETTDKGAQMRLDRMLEPSGDESIKAAVETDVTLGGLVDDVTVTSNTGYQRYQKEGGGVLLGSEWLLTVLASGSGG